MRQVFYFSWPFTTMIDIPGCGENLLCIIDDVGREHIKFYTIFFILPYHRRIDVGATHTHAAHSLAARFAIKVNEYEYKAKKKSNISEMLSCSHYSDVNTHTHALCDFQINFGSNFFLGFVCFLCAV